MRYVTKGFNLYFPLNDKAMNAVILVSAILLSLVLILLLLALFLPRHYAVSVSERIDRPQQEVFEYVSLLQNQIHYSEWLRHDPGLRPQVVGTDGTVGAILKWDSDHKDKNKNVGKGEQEIRKMEAGRIEIELRLIKPMEGTCKLVNSFIEREGQRTDYTCTFYGYARFPINLPSYVLGRRFIRKAQQQTLRNLKKIIEG